MLLAASAAVLAGCNGHRFNDDGDFKPYIVNQQDTVAGYYPETPWAYPQGTRTAEIVRRWKAAGLIMDAMTRKDGVLEITAGPQFYNLSQPSQQGLARAVARMYGGRQFQLTDWHTRRVVGVYTGQGLQLY